MNSETYLSDYYTRNGFLCWEVQQQPSSKCLYPMTTPNNFQGLNHTGVFNEEIKRKKTETDITQQPVSNY